jgi:cysteinyl-tRNA synthetase
VYDFAHIGHARTYVAFDMIARYLKFSNYDIQYLMNITDVAERVVEKSARLKLDPLQFARKYEEAFLEDMERLGIVNVDRYERASDHIPKMINQVKALMSKGVGYETETGVYFEVSKFPKFGELSRQKPEQLGLRRLELCSTKHKPEDFSLWRKFDVGTLGWESPWGFGRPGWHIEDTAISMSYFGDTYDIHGGASELIFPHHEAEIAQAEAMTGKTPFVRYWIHTGLLNIEGRKMSKSLGNVVRIRDILKRYKAQELRFYFASIHYRKPLVFRESELGKSKRKLTAINQAVAAFRDAGSPDNQRDETRLRKLLDRSKSDFIRKMDNDFDSPGALKVIETLAQKMGRLKVSRRSKQTGEAAFRQMAEVFGILP